MPDVSRLVGAPRFQAPFAAAVEPVLSPWVVLGREQWEELVGKKKEWRVDHVTNVLKCIVRKRLPEC